MGHNLCVTAPRWEFCLMDVGTFHDGFQWHRPLGDIVVGGKTEMAGRRPRGRAVRASLPITSGGTMIPGGVTIGV